MSKKNIRVLVLEDSEERLKKFRAFFAVHNHYVFEVDYTKDVDQALAWFDEKQYDIMCLDHDLDEAHYAGATTTAKTGYDFVKALTGRPHCKGVVLSVVHSVNPIGNGRMIGVLRDNDMTNWSKPFVWDSNGKMEQLVALFSHCSNRRGSGDKISGKKG